MKEMKEKIYDARTGMKYVLVGDYYLPALKLPRTRSIDRWGMLHKAYLKLRKPACYQSLLLSGSWILFWQMWKSRLQSGIRS